MLECRPVQILDVCTDPEYKLTEAQRIARHRTAMGVPLLREGVPIGAMALLRTRATAFNDKEIELALDLPRFGGGVRIFVQGI